MKHTKKSTKLMNKQLFQNSNLSVWFHILATLQYPDLERHFIMSKVVKVTFFLFLISE